jgi:excisionase family DNA binding protein
LTELSKDETEVKLYTTGEVALLCSVTPETVRNWINSGDLKAIRINNFWRVRHTDLKAFLDSKHGEVSPHV